ncbi:MAG: phospholipase [Streptosporangiaceae bacterium]|nr:phospholipase [Streptosporangiaceae bacterium]
MRSRVPATATLAMAAAIALVFATPAGAGVGDAARKAPQAQRSVPRAGPRTPIKHFIFLMQGGRTFDNYFGSYPGAEGPPSGTCQAMMAGRPKDGCVRPFALSGIQAPPLNASGTVISRQYNGGAMNGFVSAYREEGRNGTLAMGYYNRRELPFYWNAAGNYVLFDHFFSSALQGTRVNRSYWVSAAPPPGGGQQIPASGYGRQLTIFDRLQAAGISWKFYVQDYNPNATYQTAPTAGPNTQTVRVPLLNYARFVDDPVLRKHIAGMGQYYQDIANGTLPAVAYIASASDDERSARSIPAAQDMIHNLVTQLMQSRYWDSSALMWSYDGSGGWYDNVAPPRAGSAQLGLRVPALLVSAYARKGQVNHTVLDYTSALTFIERNWRLAPLTSRDARATSLASAFDFAAAARPPVIMPAVTSAQAGVARLQRVGPRGAIYGLYGAAAAVALLLFVLAALASAQTAKRRLAMIPAARRPDRALELDQGPDLNPAPPAGGTTFGATPGRSAGRADSDLDPGPPGRTGPEPGRASDPGTAPEVRIP